MRARCKGRFGKVQRTHPNGKKSDLLTETGLLIIVALPPVRLEPSRQEGGSPLPDEIGFLVPHMYERSGRSE